MSMRGTVALLLILALAGCAGDPPPVTAPVELTGTIQLPAGVTGPVHVILYHEWSGRGELRHPLQQVTAFDAAAGPFRHEFAYPVEQGEGLMVYAWVDRDGDGVLCTPARRDDLAGFAPAKGFPGDHPTVELQLDTPCRAADWFFPGKPPAG